MTSREFVSTAAGFIDWGAWMAQSLRTVRLLGGLVLLAIVAAALLLGSDPAFATMPAGSDGWQWASPTPQGNTMHAVDMGDGSHAWAVGEAGTILASSDGGTVWSSQPSGTGRALYGVASVNATRACAVGEFGTIRTTVDGGRSWEPRKAYLFEDLYAVTFSDASHGWAVGADGVIIATSDGGESWLRQDSGTFDYLYDVVFVDNRRGWAVGEFGAILSTTDGGANWDAQNSGTTEDLYSVASPDGVNACVIGGYWPRVVLRTVNSGTAWSSQKTYDILNSTAYSSDTTLFAVGRGVRRNAAGSVWETVAESRHELLDVAFADSEHGVAVGVSGGILTTGDGGSTWASASSSVTWAVAQVAFADANRGVLFDTGGAVSRTLDGGRSWAEVGVAACQAPPRSVAVGDSEHMWMTDGHHINATKNGGVTWSSQFFANPPLEGALQSVAASGPNRAWAVGSNGLILSTADGGTTWGQQSSRTTEDLSAVACVDVKTAWSVGTSGTVLATTDGGLTWEPQVVDTMETLRAVSFADKLNGCVVGDAGTVYVTRDGGRRWACIDTGMWWDLYSVTMVDRLNGWIVGDGGLLMRTTDGGLHWTKQDSGTSSTLSVVSAPDIAHGWVVSREGGLLSYRAVSETTVELDGSLSATIGYGSSLPISGRVVAYGTPVTGRKITLMGKATGGSYSVQANAVTDQLGRFSFKVSPSSLSTYQIRFAGIADEYLPAVSKAVAVSPRAWVGTPEARSTFSRSKYYTVYGYLKPRHAAGTYPVRIYKYRYVNGAWKSYGYEKAKVSNYLNYSRYERAIRLPYAGKWRLRSYAPADSRHASAWSSSYDYVTVQ